jgi:hypothetical protein
MQDKSRLAQIFSKYKTSDQINNIFSSENKLGYENKNIELLAKTRNKKDIELLLAYWKNNHIKLNKGLRSTVVNKLYMMGNGVANEDASADASRLKLVRKPGFGLYGPADGDATHISKDGKLVPLKKDTVNATPTQPSSSTTNVSTKTVRPLIIAHNSSNIKNLVSSIIEKIKLGISSEQVPDTMGTITSVYGRQTPPEYVVAGDGVRRTEANLGAEVDAVYNSETDQIEINERIKFPSTPIDKWTDQDIYNFSIYVHETLHSTADRIRYSYGYYDNARNIAIEEGITEYLTHGITSGVIGQQRMEKYQLRDTGYPNEVRAISLMADYGNLNVDAAFKSDSRELIKQIYRAEKTAIETILRKAKVPGFIIKLISNYAKSRLKQKKSPLLANPKFAKLLMWVVS